MRYSDTGFTAPSVPLLLRSARKAAGLTQAELARRMGTTQSAVSRAESLDGPDPTIAFLERYAVATGQSLTLVVRPVREQPVPEQPVKEQLVKERPRENCRSEAVLTAKQAPTVTPGPTVTLRDTKRLRALARRLGCAWIAVVDPGSPFAPPASANGEVHLVVRMRALSRRGEAVGPLKRAAERTFCRAVAVSDLDCVSPPPLRVQVARSRRALSPTLTLWAAPVPAGSG